MVSSRRRLCAHWCPDNRSFRSLSARSPEYLMSQTVFLLRGRRTSHRDRMTSSRLTSSTSFGRMLGEAKLRTSCRRSRPMGPGCYSNLKALGGFVPEVIGFRAGRLLERGKEPNNSPQISTAGSSLVANEQKMVLTILIVFLIHEDLFCNYFNALLIYCSQIQGLRHCQK